MKQKKINVLYICHDRVQLAGAVYSMINMIEAVRSSVNPYIIVRNGAVYDELQKRGYTCIRCPFQLNVERKCNKIIAKVRTYIDDIINHFCISYIIFKFRNVDIDIIHSNSVVTSIGFDLAKKLSAKHVWHIREYLDLDFNMWPVKGWDYLCNMIFKSDFVIAITKDVYKHWNLERCIDSTVLFNAVRSSKDVCIKKDKQKFFLFCSATLSDNKGADFAVTLFCKSNLYQRGYRLKMVGAYNSSYKNKLDLIAQSFSQTDYIDYIGYTSNIKDFLLNASALLMCSVREAMGRITVEALFYGCPVLGHNTGGTTEFIIDGKNGYLYDNMEDAIIKINLIIQKDEVLRLINNGAVTARNEFSIEKYGSKILNIYKKVIAK